MAKLFQSKIDRGGKTLDELLKSGELEKGKARIHLNDINGESIWVAKDRKNNVMYLMNHALMFYPMPSWGMELPLKDSLDMTPYRGESTDDFKPTVLPEVYEHLKRFVDEDNNFDCGAYFNRDIEEENTETDK